MLDGRSITLLPTEFKILTYLMRNAGQRVTRTMLFQEVWGYHFDPGTNIIDVHTRRRSAFETFQPERLLAQAHEFYEPLAQDKHQQLILQACDDCPPLQGDPALLFEALVNLMDNAIKFTQPGGVIYLRCLLRGLTLVIEVVDNGPGIAPSERNSVTRRLYRGDETRQQPGNGLGLSLVAAIARLHGFALAIEAGPGDIGTRVSLTCPLAQASGSDS